MVMRRMSKHSCCHSGVRSDLSHSPPVTMYQYSEEKGKLNDKARRKEKKKQTQIENKTKTKHAYIPTVGERWRLAISVVDVARALVGDPRLYCDNVN